MYKSLALIKMTMEITDQDTKDLTVVEEKGQFYQKGKTSVLRFSETNENNEQTDSLITINPDKVTIKRSGAVSMLQKFDQKQMTENVYRHPFGTIHMETETEQISYQPPDTRQEGKLLIKYQTSLNGDTPRKHRLTITVNKEG